MGRRARARDLVARVHEDVLGLEIAVQHARRVQVRDAEHNLRGERAPSARRWRAESGAARRLPASTRARSVSISSMPTQKALDSTAWS